MIGSGTVSLWLLTLAAFAAGGGADTLETGIKRFDDGYRAWDLARMKDSAAWLVEACTAQPDSYDAHYWLGVARFHILLHRVGDRQGPPDKKEKQRLLDEAVAPLQQAVMLRKVDSEAHALLATLLGMRVAMNPKSALWAGQEVWAHRRLALENGPANPRALYLIGSAYFHTPALLGRRDKGLDFFLKAKDLFEKEQAAPRPPLAPSWGYGSCLTFIGRIYADMGKAEEARASIERALSLNPDDKLAKECLVNLDGASQTNAKE